MIPITVSLFSKQTEGNRFIGPLAYCGGIISTFTLIGVTVSALFGAAGINKFAANPGSIWVWRRFLSCWRSTFWASSRSSCLRAFLNKVQPKGRSGIVAPLLMGFAFTLTSFTCTVPFVGTALVTAATAGTLYPGHRNARLLDGFRPAVFLAGALSRLSGQVAARRAMAGLGQGVHWVFWRSRRRSSSCRSPITHCIWD